MNNKQRVRVVLYELNDLVRMGIRNSLANFKDIELLADLASFEDLLQITGDLLPDIIIADINSLYRPIHAVNSLREQSLSTNFLFLIDEMNKDDFCIYIKNGINGLIDRNSDSEKIYSSIQAILNGVRVYSDDLICSINDTNHFNTTLNGSVGLSSRESEVLELIVNGRSNDQISKELFISLATTKTHVRNILNKLNVEDRTQAAVKSLRIGLFELNSLEREELFI